MNNQGLYLVENEDEEGVLNQLMLNDPMQSQQYNTTGEDETYSGSKKERGTDQNGQKSQLG